MNMADEMVLVWKQVSIRNEPSFLAVPFSGSELSKAKTMARMIHNSEGNWLKLNQK